MTLSLRSKTTIFSGVFLACISFAIVMPSLWPYLDGLGASKAFLALVVSGYSVGEGVGAVLFGWLSASRRTRYVMIWATLLGVAGSALYALAAMFPLVGAWMVLLGRFTQGMWTGGAQAAQQTHLSKTLPVEQLTPTTVTINAFACLGFVVGPSFALLFEYLPSFCMVGKSFCFNQLTAPGYFVWLSAVVIIFCFKYFFDDDDDTALDQISATQVPITSQGFGTDDASTKDVPPKNKLTLSKSKSTENTRLLGIADEGNLAVAVLVCNLTYFVHFYGFAVQETITTPLVQAYYGWSVHSADLLFTGAGVCTLLVFLAVQKLSDVVDDKSFVTISLLVGAMGFSLLPSRLSDPVGKTQFLIAFALITVAFPLGRATVMSLYTKILPYRYQGGGQGAILAVGAVSRILGPFVAVAVFWSDIGGWLVFGGSAAVFAVTAILFRLSYSDLWTRLEAGDPMFDEEANCCTRKM